MLWKVTPCDFVPVVWARHPKLTDFKKTTAADEMGGSIFSNSENTFLSLRNTIWSLPGIFHYFTWDLVSDSRKVAVQMKLDLRFATIYTGHFLQKIEGLLKTTFQAWISGVFVFRFFLEAGHLGFNKTVGFAMRFSEAMATTMTPTAALFKQWTVLTLSRKVFNSSFASRVNHLPQPPLNVTP